MIRLADGLSGGVVEAPFGVDALYALRGWTAEGAKWDALCANRNGDLWRQAAGIRGRAAPFKCKAHAAIQGILDGDISLRHYFGNGLADAAAGAPAEAKAPAGSVLNWLARAC